MVMNLMPVAGDHTNGAFEGGMWVVPVIRPGIVAHPATAPESLTSLP
jgi:hypothetical protein